MVGTRYSTATVTSWLTDRSLAPKLRGRRPLHSRRASPPARPKLCFAPFGLAVLVAPRVFCRLRSAPSGYFFKPSAGDNAPARLTAGFASLRINQRKKSGFLGRGFRTPPPLVSPFESRRSRAGVSSSPATRPAMATALICGVFNYSAAALTLRLAGAWRLTRQSRGGPRPAAPLGRGPRPFPRSPLRDGREACHSAKLRVRLPVHRSPRP